MRRVLFVDDEPRILDALSRMLRGFRRQWDMEFADSGETALRLCATESFDVVASDARMPGMDGTTLLREIMLQYPDTVRIILSGQCSREAVVRAVGVAHQFLTKPCNAETLKAAIQNVCGMRERFADWNERTAFSRMQRLPSQADVYDRLGMELSAAAPDIERITDVLECDVAFTAKTVQLVSSSFFGTPQHAFGATHAARLLGVETLQAVWDSSEAFLSSATAVCPDADVAWINEHSRQMALTAKRLAAAVTSDRHVIGGAYLAGMLHEVGTLAHLASRSACPSPSAPRSSRQCDLAATTGIDPGGYLTALWGLDEHVVQAISYHRAPALCPSQRFSPLTILHAAHALLDAHENTGSLPIDQAYLNRTGCDGYWNQWRKICLDTYPEGVSL